MSEETAKTPEPAADEDQFADSLSDQGVAPSVLFHSKSSPAPTACATAVGESVSRPEPPPSDKVAPNSSNATPAADGPREKPASRKQSRALSSSVSPPVAATANAQNSVLAVATAAYDHMAPLAAPPVPPTRALPQLRHPRIDTTRSKKAQTRDKPMTPKRKPTNVPVIPISSVETQVCRAARLVAHELENGGWPEVSPGARQQAAVALEEFARTIFLPTLLQQQDTQSRPSNKRVFLATMLALREILTQNAERIFSIENVPREGNEFDNDDTPGSRRRKRQHQEEERQYMAQLFGTGVAFAAIQSTPEAEPYMSAFSHMIHSYDTGQDDFCSCMERMDGHHQGVTPNNKVLKSEENVAWKVSYNRARELHPVLRRNRRRAEHQSDEAHVIEVPSTTAAFVSMVEQVPER